MISAERFLSLLEEKDLLSPKVMAKLREQVAQAKTPPNAARVAKALIDKGLLTPVLAKRLLESDSVVEATAEPEPVVEEVVPVEPEEELGLIPMDSVEPALPSERKPAAKQAPVSRRPEIDVGDDELVPLSPLGATFSPKAVPVAGISPAEIVADVAETPSGAAASGKKKGLFGFFRRDKSKKKKEDWGSIFMLVGGGSLLLLILVVGLIVWALNRQGLEQTLSKAEDFYKAQSYEQAIKTYDEFAKAFPNHKEASSARVRLNLARLRQVMQGGDWSECVNAAKTALENIKNEPNAGEANKELADLLPEIAKNLADKAKEKTSPEMVDQTREMLKLIGEHIPPSLSSPTKIADIEASLSLTLRLIERNDKLEKAVASLKEMVKQQKTAETYEIRRKLLKEYPDLLEHPKLAAITTEISQAQQAAVRNVAESKAALKEDAPSKLIATVALAQRNTKTPLEDGQGRVIGVFAEGSAFGLDAATGKVLWRRYVGYPTSGQTIAPPPIPVNTEAGADVLAVDFTQNDVVRLEATTGRMQWRFPVGEPFMPTPVLAENRVLLAAPSGKLFLLDAESGESTGYVQFPQPLRVPPAVDLTRRLIFQIADHSNLYVLGLDDLACKQVFLLGHEAGSVTSAPALVSSHIVIGVNDGAQDSSLRLFAVDRGKADKPGITIKQTQSIPLKGRIDITPAVDSNRVLVATDRGVVRVLDLAPMQDKGVQLQNVAETAIEGGENVTRFALLRGGQFLIADMELKRYDIISSKGSLLPKWTIHERCAFLQTPVAVGGSVIAARRKANQPGVFVSAVGIEEPNANRPDWETVLAVPPVGDLIVGGEKRKLTAVNKLGGLFEIDEGALKDQGMIDAPLVSIDPARLQQPIGAVTVMEKGFFALSPIRDAAQLNVYNPAEGQPQYLWLGLSEKSTCPPIELAGGLLAPCGGGAIFLLDPLSGKPMAAPFQAPLGADAQPIWQKPACCGKQEFVIADGRNKIYRIGRVDSPKPHLAVLDSADAPKIQEAPAAVLGNIAFVADDTDALGIYELPKFKRIQEQKLSGRCVLGPAAFNDRVLIATDDNQLLCLDAKGEKLWQIALEYGPLAGSPLVVEDGYVLASSSGVIYRIDAKAGKESGKIETGRALATGPAAMGDRLYVGGSDGSIYEVKLP